MADSDQVIVVTGATGRQGGAVARHLLAEGWSVRGLTRSPDSKAARQLAALGVDVIRADMVDPEAMREACAGAHGVFSVQNAMISGEEGELAQAKNVVDAAADVGVSHLVYGSAGPGTAGTGVAAWDVKLEYPPVAAWHLMPRLVGEERPIPWLAVDDLGVIAAHAFRDPGSYVGADLALAADVRTLRECREIWRHETGRNPRRFPMPVWLFERFVGPDLTRMWRWLATHDIDLQPAQTRAHHPAAVDVEQFVRRRARGAT